MLKPLVEKGLRTIILFGVVTSEEKDSRGTKASGNAVTKTIQLLRAEIPELMIICDLCLCPYTDHGHCGILKEDETIDNEKSVIRLGEIALDYIAAGAHMIAPSDCMDCRIGYLKNLFREKDLQIPVMSYGAKFCSKLYGPFRTACGSAPSKTGRNQYQLPMGSAQLAMRALERDIEEGADIIMVKPGIFYLDIIARISERGVSLPICSYQTSGEYAMLFYGAEKGIFDLDEILIENLTAYKRAGASLLMTYFAPRLMDLLDH